MAEPISVRCTDGAEMERLLSEGCLINSTAYDDTSNSYYINFIKLDADESTVEAPFVYWTGASRRNHGLYHRSLQGLGWINPVGLVDPSVLTRLYPAVGGFGDSAGMSPDSSSGGGSGANPPPPPPPPTPPSESSIIGTLLGAMNEADRSNAAKDYLEHLKWQQNWRIMPEAVLLDGLAAKSIGADELSADIVRAKVGVPAGERRNFLIQVVATAKEVQAQTKTWGRLAWPALMLLILSLAASLFFTYRGFQLVGDGKLHGYELIILIFVLGLVAVSPTVLLLLQRPLKGIDHWSPAALKSSADDSEPAKNKL